MPDWPQGLQPYRRTPTFDNETIPAGLQRAHSTRPGTWARLHVLDGELRFRDLASNESRLLGPGIHPVIHPERLHEVALTGPVRFFVEFCARPEPPTA